MNTLLTAPLFFGLGLISGDSSVNVPHFRQVSIPVDRGPRWVATADLNHDGNTDIIVANADAGTVTVLLGDGRGNLHHVAGSPFAAGHLPNDLAIADMNGDGNLDVVVANHQAPYISVLLGDGTGKLAPAPGSPFDVHSSPHPHGVVAADFDGDGKTDVVTDSWGINEVELLSGDGKGGLHLPGRFFRVGHRPYERLRSADFNRDGHPDLVTTNLDDGTVSILLGDGRGGFVASPGSPYAAGGKPWQAFIGDINGDGNADIVTIPYQRDLANAEKSEVTVLLGDGHGSFSRLARTPLPLGECRGADSITAGTLQSDQITIAVACAESRELVLFTRDAAGHFSRSTIAAKGGWGGITIASLTKDSRSEIITADNENNTITIFFPD